MLILLQTPTAVYGRRPIDKYSVHKYKYVQQYIHVHDNNHSTYNTSMVHTTYTYNTRQSNNNDIAMTTGYKTMA